MTETETEKVAAEVELFEDEEFPAEDASLGDSLASRLNIKWRRPGQLAPKRPWSTGATLFNTIEPSDIRQGSLGDCWLLSSLASLAEFPEVVKHCFVRPTVSADGQYCIRIFEPSATADEEGHAEAVAEGRWIEVVIDDRLPCLDSFGRFSPAFAQSVDREFWVCLVEKAFAKHVGSYGALSNGFPALAFTALTGASSVLYSFSQVAGAVGAVRELHFGDLTVRRAAELDGSAPIFRTGRTYPRDAFWQRLKFFDEADYLMTLNTAGKDEFSEAEGPRAQFGLVGGHAYSLIQAREVGGFRLVQIQNPWGHFEWGGRWSDISPLWGEHPQVAEELEHRPDNKDGLFWMAFDDVLTEFTSVNVSFLNRSAIRAKVGEEAEEGEPEAPPLVLWWRGLKHSLARFKAKAGGAVDVAVDEALLTCRQLHEYMEQAFLEADTDGDDTVSLEELHARLAGLWPVISRQLIRLDLYVPRPSQAELDQFLEQSDVALQDGKLDLAEFELLYLKLAKYMVRRIALQAARRYGAAAAAGTAAAMCVKRALRPVPVIGGAIKVLCPSLLIGPAAGVAGMWLFRRSRKNRAKQSVRMRLKAVSAFRSLSGH